MIFINVVVLLSFKKGDRTSKPKDRENSYKSKCLCPIMEINLHKLGLLWRWEGKQLKDYERIRKHNKKLWKNWKADNGFGHSTPLENVPGFLESVERLHLSGYGFTDLGLDYGISHQRMSQIFKDYELKRNPYGDETMLRQWSYIGNRFISIKPLDIKEKILEKLKTERKEGIKLRQEIARNADAEAVLLFIEKYGRQPSLREIAKNRGYSENSYSTIERRWMSNGTKSFHKYISGFNHLFTSVGIKRDRKRGNHKKSKEKITDKNFRKIMGL